MKSKEKVSMIKTVIVSLVLCGMFVASCFIFFLFLPQNPATPPESTPPITPPPPPTPIINAPDNIAVKLLDNSKCFEYSVTNLGNYAVGVIVEDLSVATLENNIIKPKKIGTTKIITTINCTPKVTKETILKVTDCVKEINLLITDINGLIPERYFTNTKYILKLQQNIIENNMPLICYAESSSLAPKLIANNIQNINYLKTENNCYYYEFNIINNGNFSFEYKGEFVNANIQNSALNYPTNFSVNFENNLLNNSNINLYLFNENHLGEANQNNIYNKAKFVIKKIENSYDEITVSVSNNNIASIVNDQIIAISEGSAQITFKSLISNYEIKINITVSKINLKQLMVNNEVKNLNSTINVTLNNNEEFNLIFSPNPIYAICNLTLHYNDAEIEYKDNKIKLLNNITNSTIHIKDGENIVYTINLTLASNLTLSLSLKYPTTSNIVNNELKISKNSFAQIICKVYDLNYPNATLPFGEYTLTYDETYISLLDPNVSAGSIALEFLEVGTTQILITNITHNVSMILTVIIV